MYVITKTDNKKVIPIKLNQIIKIINLSMGGLQIQIK